MMAGLITSIDSSDFYMNFLLAELLAYLSSHLKEGLLMIIKVSRKTMSCVKQQIRNAIISLGDHLPFRLSLLMIW